MAELEGYNRNQYMFICYDDMVGKTSIVRIIEKIVMAIVPEDNSVNYGVGRPSYPVRYLLGLLIYGYLFRIKSSRDLERACKVNVEVQWLMHGLTPDHWTINEFRRKNGDLIERALKMFIRFLEDTGYVEGKEIVIDGTKFKANASTDEVIKLNDLKERIEDADRKIVYYLERIDRNDEMEEELNRLREEKERLERRVKELEEEKKRYYVKTDPEANLMKTREGSRAAYNVQIACDTKNKMILATDVSSSVNDAGKLEEVYEKVKEVLGGEKVEEIIADSGYYVPEQIERLEKEEGLETFITPLPEQTQGEFRYDEEKDEYICSMGEHLRFKKQTKDKRGRIVRHYQTNNCGGCPIRSSCTKSKIGRTKIRYLNQMFRDEYRKKMMEEGSIKKIKLRKSVVEHPIGTIKRWLGKVPLLLRGKEKVQTELNIVVFAYDLLRAFNIDGFEKLMEKIEKYDWEMALK